MCIRDSSTSDPLFILGTPTEQSHCWETLIITFHEFLMEKVICFIRITIVIQFTPVHSINSFFEFFYIFWRMKFDKRQFIGFMLSPCIIFNKNKIREVVCYITPKISTCNNFIDVTNCRIIIIDMIDEGST